MKRISYTPEQINRIKSQYLAGVPMDAICAEHGAGGNYIRKVLKQAGVKLDRTNATYGHRKVERDALIVEMYKGDAPIEDIAAATGVKRCCVRRVIKRAGLPRRKPGWHHKHRPFVPRVDRETLIRLYHTEKVSTKAIGEQYGVSDGTVLNWLSFYDISLIPVAERAALKPCYGHHSWKGGVTPFRVALVTRLAAWKRLVKRRDGYKCRRCTGKNDLEVHHTKPLRLIIREFKEAFPAVDIGDPSGLDFALKTVVGMHSPEMGICLCRKCHEEVDEWRGRFKESAEHLTDNECLSGGQLSPSESATHPIKFSLPARTP